MMRGQKIIKKMHNYFTDYHTPFFSMMSNDDRCSSHTHYFLYMFIYQN
jgi:hypothetical protein